MHQSIHDQCQPGMSKSMETIRTFPSQFCHWTCIVRIPGNIMAGESFFRDYLNVWVLWLRAFIWSPAKWKSAWTDAGKLTEDFGTNYGWAEDDCGKKSSPKARSLRCSLGLYACTGLKWASLHFTIDMNTHVYMILWESRYGSPTSGMCEVR